MLSKFICIFFLQYFVGVYEIAATWSGPPLFATAFNTIGQNLASENTVFKARNTSGPSIPNEYIIQLKKTANVSEHRNWILSQCSHHNKLAKRGILDYSDISSFGKIIKIENFPNSFYTGTFSSSIIETLKNRDDVKRIEPNHIISISGSFSQKERKRTFLKKRQLFSNIIRSSSSNQKEVSKSDNASPPITVSFGSGSATNSSNMTTVNATLNQNQNQLSVEKNPMNWGLDRIDQLSLPLNQEFDYVTNGGSNTDVYVFDSGVNEQHVDLAGRASNVFCTTSVCTDDEGHGSHVAGIIAGTEYGVAKGAQIRAIKIINSEGDAKISDMLKALQWLGTELQNRVGRKCVINLSFTGTDINESLNDAITSAVQEWDCVVVTAAGNKGEDACNFTPGASQSVINVGSIDQNDQVPWFSNVGNCVSQYAPGTDILSLSMGSNTATQIRSGTSMSAPFVTGVVAVYRSIYPDVKAQDILQLLVNNDSTGYYDINLHNSSTMIQGQPWSSFVAESPSFKILYSQIYQKVNATKASVFL